MDVESKVDTLLQKLKPKRKRISKDTYIYLGVLIVASCLGTLMIIPASREWMQETFFSAKERPLSPLGDWWDVDWSYYKYITVSNKIDDWQTMINVTKTSGGDVDCEGHCKDDFGDLRFVYDNTTELPYWIENFTSGVVAKVWVNNSGNYSGFQMFYGNASATTTSFGNTTFDFFDHFLGAGINSDVWSEATSYATVSGSKLTYIGSATTWRRIIANYNSSLNMAFRHKSKWQGRTTNKGAEITLRHGSSINDYIQMLYLTTTNKFRNKADGVSTDVDTNIDENENIYEIRRTAGNSYWYKNDVAMTGSPDSNNIPTVGLPVFFQAIGDAGYGIESDWVLLRKYKLTNAPSFSFGSEQSAPTPPANNPPVNSNPSPSSGATGQSLNSTLGITVNDSDGNTMNQSFWTNASDSWTVIAWNNNTANATLSNSTIVFPDYLTKYWWSSNVSDGTDWDNDTYSFTTGINASVQIWICSDVHVGKGTGDVYKENFNLSVNDTNAIGCNYSFMIGDVIHEDTEVMENWDDFHEVWDRLNVTYMNYTIGNHDANWGTYSRLTNLNYTYQVGNILFIMLGDSNTSKTTNTSSGIEQGYYDNQLMWLNTTIQANSDKNIIVLSHHPVKGTTYNSNGEGFPATAGYINTPQDFLDFIEWVNQSVEYNIDAWLHGHAHYGQNESHDSMVVEQNGTLFANVGCLAMHWGTDAPHPIESTYWYFNDKSKEVTFIAYNHNTSSFYDNSEYPYTFNLTYAFTTELARTWSQNTTFWFEGGNYSSWQQNDTFWFSGGNVSTTTQVTDFWFTGGNISNWNQETTFWFVGGNVSVRTWNQTTTFWFEGGNYSSWEQDTTFWFSGGNVSSTNQVTTFWFSGGNISTTNQETVFWFEGGNHSSWEQETTFWFVGGNNRTTNQETIFWFSGGNLSNWQQQTLFWFLGGNVSAVRTWGRNTLFWFLGGNISDWNQESIFWFEGGNVSSTNQVDLFWFTGGNISNWQQNTLFWFVGGSARSWNQNTTFWFTGGNISTTNQVTDFWFYGGNVSNWQQNTTFWFVGGNISDWNQETVFWFLGGNVSAARTWEQNTTFWFEGGNYSSWQQNDTSWFSGGNVSSTNQVDLFWFTGGNVSNWEQNTTFWFVGGSARTWNQNTTFWFEGGNVSSTNQLDLFWFSGGNVSSTNQVTTFWFEGGNISSTNQVTTFWFEGGNVSAVPSWSQITTFWFVGGNVTDWNQETVFWFLGGNETLVITITNEYPENGSDTLITQPLLYFNFTTPSGRLMNYSIYLGNSPDNCNIWLCTFSNVGNGTHRNDSQYYSAVNFTSYCWRIQAEDGINMINETFNFTILRQGGGGVTSRLGTAVAMGVLAGLAGSIIFGLLFVKKKKERWR